MTQSADQQLVDSPTQGPDTPPARNFSADAFRALTQRLKSSHTGPTPSPRQPVAAPPSTTTTVDMTCAPQAPEPVAQSPSEPVVAAIEGTAPVAAEAMVSPPMPQAGEVVCEPQTMSPVQPSEIVEAQSQPEPVAQATMINLDGDTGLSAVGAIETPPDSEPVLQQQPQPTTNDPLAAAMALLNSADVAPDATALDAWQDTGFDMPIPGGEQAPDAAPQTQPEIRSEPAAPALDADSAIFAEPDPVAETAVSSEAMNETVPPEPPQAATAPIDIVVFDQQSNDERSQQSPHGEQPAPVFAEPPAPKVEQPANPGAEPRVASEPLVEDRPDTNAMPTEFAAEPSSASAHAPELLVPPIIDEPGETEEAAPQTAAAPSMDTTSDEQQAPDIKTNDDVTVQSPAKSGASQADAPSAQPVVPLKPDEKSGETARALLDMMSTPSGAAQPQERALVADTLLQLIPTMPKRDLVALSERVCMMEEGPQLLVQALINHPDADVARPLLENAPSLGDQELLKLAASAEVDRLIMIAKRRNISSGIVDALIARGETSVDLTIVRNPGAQMSHDAFITLSQEAKSHPNLQAPLATRGDTPPPIAFELFWSLPIELRRYVLSRFLTDSATLDKILKIAQSIDSNRVESDEEPKFPPKARVEEFVAMVADGFEDKAANLLAELGDVHPENARRIIADPDGEPITVALKTLGCSRTLFSEALKRFSTSRSAMLSPERNLEELSALFDSLSFNKARTLMKYWDWAIEKSGPYTRRMM